jgi:hypothetical protein
MFQSNGIEMNRDEIEVFFELCKTNCRGYLSFGEFKALYQNANADTLFRFFIKRARDMNASLHGEGVNTVYLPFNLSRLLEHMSLKQRRETVHNRIDDDKFIYGKTIDTVKNFVKLFIIDQGAIDTISKDEWSRKITTAIAKQELQEKKERGEKVTSNDMEIAECLMPADRASAKNDGAFSLKRLDSFHLN